MNLRNNPQIIIGFVKICSNGSVLLIKTFPGTEISSKGIFGFCFFFSILQSLCETLFLSCYSVTESNPNMEVEKKYITIEELKKHNKSEDVWISIQGKVYDVSNWLKDHPGGDAPLMNLAGQDVTDVLAYHPGTACQYLNKFFTGYHLQDFKFSEVSRDYRRLASEFSKLGLFKKKGHVTLFFCKCCIDATHCCLWCF